MQNRIFTMKISVHSISVWKVLLEKMLFQETKSRVSPALEMGVVFCSWSLREGKALQVIAKRLEWERDRGKSDCLILHLKRISNNSILENHLSAYFGGVKKFGRSLGK